MFKKIFKNYLLICLLVATSLLFATTQAKATSTISLTPADGTNCVYPVQDVEFRWTYSGAKTISKFIMKITEVGLNNTPNQIIFLEEYPANMFGHNTNLNPGREYIWEITAAFTDLTEEAIQATFNTSLPNNSPTIITPVDQCSTTLQYVASWSYPEDDLAEYQLEISKQSQFVPIAVFNTTDTVLEINNPELEFNGIFYYRVRAKSLFSDCFTNWSNIKSGKILSKPLTPEFSHISLEDGAECVYINPDIFLEKQSGTTLKYFIEIAENDTFNPVLETFSSASEIVQCFMPKFVHKYYYRAYVIDTLTNCMSDYSEIRNLTTRFEQPNLISPADNAKGSDAFENNSNSLIQLEWENPNSGDAIDYDYNIRIALSENFLPSEIISEAKVQGNTSYEAYLTIPSAFNDTLYWQVNTVKDGCTSDWSTIRKFFSPYESPVAVAPNPQEKCFIRGDFRWEKSKGADGYEVYLSTDKNFADTNNIKIFQVYGNLDSLFVEITNPETVYYWKVRAIDANNSSFWSNVLEFRTATAIPVLVSPANNQSGVELSATFNWIEKKHATYRFQLSIEEDFSNALIDTLLDTNSININLEINNGLYYWRLANIVNDCRSDWSDSWSFVTKLPSPVITSPENNSTLEFSAVMFTWDKVSGATSYELQYSLDSTFETSNYITKIPFNYYYDNYLLADTLYYWRVKSTSATTESEWTLTYSFRSGIYKPTKPALVSPKNTVNKIPANTQFVWNKIDNIDTYILQYSTTENFTETTTTTITNILDTLYTSETPLENFTRYYWRVSSVNKSIQSDWSDIWSFRTIKAAPKTAPALVSPINNSTDLQWDEIRLFWNSVEDASWYAVQVSNENTYIINNPKVADTSLAMMSNLDTNKTYQWRVRAENEGGESPWSNTWEFTTSKNLSIYEISFISAVLALPNPATNNLLVEFSVEQPMLADIIIIDLTGREVCRVSNYYEIGNNSAKLNTTNISNGKYLCYISTNNKIIAATQIIINK